MQPVTPEDEVIKEASEKPRLQQEIERLHTQDGIPVPTPRALKQIIITPTTTDYVREQYEAMGRSYTGLFDNQEVRRLITEERPVGDLEAQVGFYRSVVAERIPVIEERLREAGRYTPDFNPITGETLASDSFLRFLILYGQGYQERHVTEEELRNLMVKREELQKKLQEKVPYSQYDATTAFTPYGMLRQSPIDWVKADIDLSERRVAMGVKLAIEQVLKVSLRTRGELKYTEVSSAIALGIADFERTKRTKIPRFDLETNEELPLGSEKRLEYAKQIAEGTLVLTPSQRRHDRALLIQKELAQVTESPFGYREVFNPEIELQRIRTLHNSKRHAAMREFQEKAQFQRDGWAYLRERLTHELSIDPSITRDEMENVLLQYRSIYGFPDSQVNKAREYWDGYEQRREVLRQFREAHQTNNEVSQALFGQVRPMEVQYLPTCILIRPASHAGYNELANDHSHQSGGIMLFHTNVPELDNAVILIRPDSSDSVVVHEEQHVIHRLFHLVGDPSERVVEPIIEAHNTAKEQERKDRAILSRIKRSLQKLAAKVTKQPYIEEVKAKEDPVLTEMKRYLYNVVDLSFERVKDEAFAYFRDGDTSLPQVIAYLRERNGSYDYLSRIKTYFLQNIETAIGGDYSFHAQRLMGEILEGKRGERLEQGVRALYELERYGFSKEQAIDFLTHKPFRKWRREVDRIKQRRAERQVA